MHKCASLLRPPISRGVFGSYRDANIGAIYIVRNVSSTPASRATAGLANGRLDQASSKPVQKSSHNTALSKLPLSSVLRSYLIMSMSSSNVLLGATMHVLQRIVHSKSSLLDPARNSVLNWILRRSFYDQFCAGDTKSDIEQTIEDLHRIGFQGIILEYAPEVLEDAKEDSSESATTKSHQEIETWKQGMLETVSMVGAGDFVGLKWSGMGSEALRLLKHNQPPSPRMMQAMTALCDAAATRGVKLLPAAEPQNANKAVDAWTLMLASKYNKSNSNFALVYNTYQCYLKSNSQNLARHLAQAAEEGFTLGIKLVRGAYLGSEQRDLIWDTKAETDKSYDEITASLLEKKYGQVLQSATGSTEAFPNINIMLATHNEDSVLKAQAILDNLSPSARSFVKLDFAQLQGMADEVSCGLLGASDPSSHDEKATSNSAKVYKCVTWGSTAQCLHYLLRRAAENRDAFTRTVQTRRAMGIELRRRIKSVFGMG